MKVKALKKVPVLIDGEIVNIEPGNEYEVTAEVGDALLRGGDAACVAEEAVKVPVEVEAEIQAAIEEENMSGKSQRKNAGRAPLNKNAGKAPEDK